MTKKIEKKGIILKVKKFIKSEGRLPKKEDFSKINFKKKYGLPVPTTIRTKFGGLNKLLKSLKTKLRLYTKNYTKNQATREIRNFIKKNKRYPLSAKECNPSNNLPGHAVLIKLFGSHKKAMRAAGYKGFVYETNLFFDKNFFRSINSEAKAYFLGLMFSDGWVLKNEPRFGLGLKITDLHIIKTFKKYIKAKKEIYFNDKTTTNRNINPETQATLTLNSQITKNHLMRLGIIPRKSLKIKFPNNKKVPDKYLKHFVRGYFDGDGSISKSKRVDFTCGSRVFLIGLRKILESKLSMINLRIENRTQSTNLSKTNRSKRLYIQQKEYIKKLFFYMYSNTNSELRLKRKYLAYKKVLRRF